MQAINERNPYLKRLNLSTPHKYSYDLNSGKHYLLTPNGNEKQINKIGTFRPKFKKNLTGFVSYKQRYEESKSDHSSLHYVPDLKYIAKKGYTCPMPDKFAGYTQYPYKLGDFPSHLILPDSPKKYSLGKSNSQHENSQQKEYPKAKSQSIILETTTMFLKNQNERDKYFQMSYDNMTLTRPLPKHRKKSCYNYKCKYMKHFTFDKKLQIEQSTAYNTTMTFTNTFGKSFHQKKFDLEKKEALLIQNME